MAAYVWEIGIDWDSVHNGNGRYFLQEGFVLGDAMAPRRTKLDDTITFKIFDLTQGLGAEPLHLMSFCIITKSARAGDPPDGDPFSHLQPELPPRISGCVERSVAFGGAERVFPVWECPPVTVTTEGRFLVSFLAQARSPQGKSTSRYYGVDPEMVVGSNM